jgi:hypothetical protein
MDTVMKHNIYIGEAFSRPIMLLYIRSEMIILPRVSQTTERLARERLD